MRPPSPRKFQSQAELLEYVHTFSFSQGYATSIRDSRRDKYVRICCDRGGTYRDRSKIPNEERPRRTGTRLINCPFEINGKSQDDGSWVLGVRNGEHNHEPSVDMSAHPLFRRFSKEEYSRIKEMTKSGIAPRQVMTSLRQANPEMLAVSRTLYSAKAKIRKEELKGRTPIQALLEELSEGGFSYDFRRDEGNHLTHLFLAHPLSITLSKNYHSVFVMDCTYKTNKFHMPLLNIVGVTSFNTSFYSSFAFLSKEKEEDYIWALGRFKKMIGAAASHPMVFVTDRELALMKAIEVVFPEVTHLLCVWHIEKNILQNCKPEIDKDPNHNWDDFLASWTAVIWSHNETMFDDAWKELGATYKNKPAVINYLKNTWLPFKELFVKAWTNKHLHFGNQVTSRAEGAHAVLKDYLQVSTGNLHMVKQNICLAIENSFKEVTTQVAREKIRAPHNVRSPFFKELLYSVLAFALEKLYEQYKKATSVAPLPPCTGYFSSSMGLPCAHMMRERLTGLHLSDIHLQWQISGRSFTIDKDNGIDNEDGQLKKLLRDLENQYEHLPTSQKEVILTQLSQLTNASVPIVFDPIIQPHKGRRVGSKAKRGSSSTTRDPSGFEIVENKRGCGICKKTGHNKRTCPQNVEVLTSLNVEHVPNTTEIENSPHFLDLNSLPEEIGIPFY